MLQKDKLGAFEQAPQPKSSAYVPLKPDHKTTNQRVFKGLVNKDHHPLVNRGIGRSTSNRRGG